MGERFTCTSNTLRKMLIRSWSGAVDAHPRDICHFAIPGGDDRPLGCRDHTLGIAEKPKKETGQQDRRKRPHRRNEPAQYQRRKHPAPNRSSSRQKPCQDAEIIEQQPSSRRWGKKYAVRKEDRDGNGQRKRRRTRRLDSKQFFPFLSRGPRLIQPLDSRLGYAT